MKLFESGEIGKLYIKNRIIMAPMGIGGLVEPRKVINAIWEGFRTARLI